mgnify:CR=1 FL=1
MNIKTKLLFITIAGVLSFSSCDKDTPEDELKFPVCFKGMIAAVDTVDEITKITEYDYSGGKVYLLHNSAMVVDYGPLLYDENCNLVCFSGIAGWQAVGTNNRLYCDSFISLSENPVVVWEKL